VIGVTKTAQAKNVLGRVLGVKCGRCNACSVPSPIRYVGEITCKQCGARLKELSAPNWFILLVATAVIGWIIGQIISEWIGFIIWIVLFLVLSTRLAKFETVESETKDSEAGRPE
jgi:hypothetical protein